MYMCFFYLCLLQIVKLLPSSGQKYLSVFYIYQNLDAYTCASLVSSTKAAATPEMAQDLDSDQRAKTRAESAITLF